MVKREPGIACFSRFLRKCDCMHYRTGIYQQKHNIENGNGIKIWARQTAGQLGFVRQYNGIHWENFSLGDWNNTLTSYNIWYSDSYEIKRGNSSLKGKLAKVWNTLPVDIRDTTKSVPSFKTLLRKHYIDLTSSIFNPDDPRTLKSVCVKCHTSRPLWNLLSRPCC